MQEVVPELGGALADPAGRPLLDVVLELVDLLVQRVDRVQVALRDVVDELAERLRRTRPVTEGRRRRSRVVGLSPLRRLAHGQQGLQGEGDVDLLVEDLVVGGRDGDEEDPEDVFAVGLQLRPRLVAVACRLAQQLQRTVVDARREQPIELFGSSRSTQHSPSVIAGERSGVFG